MRYSVVQLLRQCALITSLIASLLLLSCGGNNSSSQPTPAPTVDGTLADLQRVFDKYLNATFKVRYRVRFSSNMSSSPRELGFVTQEKVGTSRKRFETSGDVARLGIDDLIVLVDGDAVYFCSRRLQVSETRTEPGCHAGDAARESAQFLVSGVGLTLELTRTTGTSDLALRQASQTRVAGILGTCFEYGSAKLSNAPPVQDCFSDDGILLSRRFSDGDSVTQIEAVDVGLPTATDFTVPYPLREG